MDRNLKLQSDASFLRFGISFLFSLQGLCGTLRVQTWSFLGWHCQDTGWVFLSVQNKDRKLGGELESSSPHTLLSSPLLLWGLWCFSGQDNHKVRWGELIKQRFPGPTLGFSVCGKGSEEPPLFSPEAPWVILEQTVLRNSVGPMPFLEAEASCYLLPSTCIVLWKCKCDGTGRWLSSFVLCADVLRRAVGEPPDVFIQRPKESGIGQCDGVCGGRGSRIQGKVVEEGIGFRKTNVRDEGPTWPKGALTVFWHAWKKKKKKFKQHTKQKL